MDWRQLLMYRPRDLVQQPEPQLQQQQQQQPAQPRFGTGLLQGAADATNMYPKWQEAFINGETSLQYPDWLKAQGIHNPIMPPTANAK